MSKFKVGDKIVADCGFLKKLQKLSDKEIATVLEIGENGKIRLDGTDPENNSCWFDEDEWILSKKDEL